MADGIKKIWVLLALPLWLGMGQLARAQTAMPVGEAAEAVVTSPEISNPSGTIEFDSSQVTSVTQLSDVQPTDWAYQAVQSLVERYGCIVGYPNSRFQGNRSATRYEIAAALNACLDVISDRFATKEDLLAVRKLQTEFAQELAALKGRVNGLEARTAKLEAQQFSTTTKLSGEAIVAFTDVLTGDSDPLGVGVSRNNPVLAYRLRLNFITSFTGKDELKVRLQTANVPHPQRPGGFRYGADPILGNFGILATTPEGGQTFNQDFPAAGANQLELSTLSYRFPVGQRLTITAFANRGEHVDYLPNVFSSVGDGDDGGNGALSTFAQYNPIYRIGSGAGAGLTYRFNNAFSFSLGYLATDAGNPEDLSNENIFGGGLFNGRYGALAQLTFQPRRNLALGVTYVNSYTGGPPIFLNDVGTTSANIPSLISADNLRLSTNTIGVSGLWQPHPRFAMNAWFMYSNVRGDSSAGLLRENADIFSYAVALAFPDLGKQGNLGGLVIGVPPHATRYNIADPFIQSLFGGVRDLVDFIPERSTPFHFEAFYRHRINDNISITPGIIWLRNTNQTSLNPDVVIGTLRTTFTF
jgi:hypothetical protein